MIYKDDNIKISMITVAGKKELAIDYYQAGFYLGRMVTKDLKDMNLVEIKLPER